MRISYTNPFQDSEAGDPETDSYTWVILSALEKFPDALNAVREAVATERDLRDLARNACPHCRQQKQLDQQQQPAPQEAKDSK